MKDSPANKQLIMSTTDALRESLSDRIQWQWDKHHQALLAEFSVDHEQHVYLTLLQHFPVHFDKKTIKQASPELKHQAGKFAQLSKEQQLLVSESQGQSEVMVAWWPWGHGATVSVRIFRIDPQPYVPPTGLLQWCKSVFNR